MSADETRAAAESTDGVHRLTQADLEATERRYQEEINKMKEEMKKLMKSHTPDEANLSADGELKALGGPLQDGSAMTHEAHTCGRPRATYEKLSWPRFSGRALEDIDNFVWDFNNVRKFAAADGWDETALKSMLPTLVEGSAKTYLRRCSLDGSLESRSLDEVLEALRVAFSVDKSKRNCRSELNRIHMGENETVHEYAYRVIDKVMRVNINMDDDERIFHFVEGLGEPLRSKVVYLSSSLKEQTFDEVVDLANTIAGQLAEESAYQNSRSKELLMAKIQHQHSAAPIRSTVTEVSATPDATVSAALVAAVEALNDNIGRMGKASGRPRDRAFEPRRPFECYICGEAHSYRDCPLKGALKEFVQQKKMSTSSVEPEQRESLNKDGGSPTKATK